MASLLTCIATSATWCFCTAAGSLLSACCGNDKPSTVAAGPSSGRKRSVALLFCSIILQIVFQYGLAPTLAGDNSADFDFDAWISGCEQHVGGDKLLLESCVGNYANYRVAAATTLFFVLAAFAAALKPTANREAWPAKFVLWLFLVVGFVFIDSDPTFSKVYLNVARIGSVLFIIFEQLIIVDLSYNWNDSWVEKSNKAEAEEAGSGQKWLAAILISCAILFSGALAVLIYMFVDFTGCPTNNAFVSLTLIFCIGLTAAQLTGEEGSLLSSASISAWACFLCYSAVSMNPDASCNPRLGEASPLSVAFGLTVSLISLCWTGWSYTAEDKLTTKKTDEENNNVAEEESGENVKKSNKVTGIVTGGGTNEDADADADNYGAVGAESRPADYIAEEQGDEEAVDPHKLSNSWRLNIALAAVACWSAMILTHWGEIQSNGTLANPNVSRVGMWMIIGSQWLVMTLYVWTLVAPRLFPDRDFS